MKHQVSRLLWQTDFDGERQQAYQLQEILSHWTNSILKGLLDSHFSRYCPSGFTWRIDQLTLDLGDIEYEKLTEQLPQKVAEALSVQLYRLLQRVDWQSGQSLIPEFLTQTDGHDSDHNAAFATDQRLSDNQLIADDNAWQGFIRHYLKSGVQPWWYNGSLSHRKLMEQKLHQAPKQVASIVRQIGEHDNVRKRLVWQYHPSPFNHLVKALEPYHHQTIEDFAEHLIDSQKQQNLGASKHSLAKQSWYWILTHLLVERGSLFNTSAFVISTLQQMANHYQLDYALLVEQMLNAAHQLKQQSDKLPVFVQALLEAKQQLGKHITAKDVSKELSKAQPDYWLAFEQGLKDSGKITQTFNLAEAFAMLAKQDAAKMAKLLRRIAHSQAVRNRIITAFSETELAALVVVVAPNDHQFVLTHIDHCKQNVGSEKSASDMAVIWHIVLAYLLNHSGSYFNRKQFVEHTLRKWSQARGLDYSVLLDLLASVPPGYQASGQRFELLSILSDLSEHNEKSDKHYYIEMLSVYLSHGKWQSHVNKKDKHLKLNHPQALFTLLLYRQPQALAKFLTESFATNHQSPKWLARLIAIITPADIGSLIAAIAPQTLNWLPQLLALDCENGLEAGLVMLLTRGNRQSATSGALDIFCALDMLVKLAPSFKYVVTVAVNQQLKTASTGLTDELKEALQLWLKQLNSEQNDNNHNLQKLTPIEQIIALLIQENRANTLNSEQQRELIELLNQQLPSKGDGLLQALAQNPKSNQLALILLSKIGDCPVLKAWLLSLWPQISISREKLLEIVSTRLQTSGLYHGSLALLEQTLRQQLWLTVLTQAIASNSNSQDFWRHWILALTRPLGLTINQLLPALLAATDSSTSQSSISQSSIYKSSTDQQDELAQSLTTAITHAVHTDGWINHIEHHTNDDSESHTSATDKPLIIDASGKYLQQANMVQVLVHWLRFGRAPLWYSCKPSLSLSALITDVLAFKPALLITVLRHTKGHSSVIRRLAYIMEYKSLINLLGQHEPTLVSKLSVLQRINGALSNGLFTSSNSHLNSIAQMLLWQYTIDSWLTGHSSQWHSLQPDMVVSALYGQLTLRYPSLQSVIVDELAEGFSELFTKASNSDNQTVQQTLQQLLPSPAAQKHTQHADIHKADTQHQPQENTMPIAVNNAGLVIFNNFIQTYFSRLELTNDDGFIDQQAQLAAVHYLQYLVTGHDSTDETHLALNKVLCGLPMSTPVPAGIEITDEQKQLAEGLIDAVINHWSAIGSSSIEGFRGNWLVREGLLSETEEHWELVVEKRSYDLLLDRLPFGFSLVRLPFMDKPLYVTWPT